MILYRGEIHDTKEQNRLLDGLEETITQVLQRPAPAAETVIAACDGLARRVLSGEFDGIIAALGLDKRFTLAQAAAAANMLRRDSLEFKLNLELGPDWAGPKAVTPPHSGLTLTKEVLPLGVLFHIAAGNVDGLPAYSAVEGLLTGNVNILKLPQADGGLSVLLLHALTQAAPELADYLYVFDTPSDDLPAMQKMAAMADGIVVWGGEGAVSAVRGLAPTSCRLIEWGHKLSFAYVTPKGETPEALYALAAHIADTRQLLCSSCQAIFLDTEKREEVRYFCRRFLPVLEGAMAAGAPLDDGSAAQVTLAQYEQRLESITAPGPEIFYGKSCSLTVGEDGELELSLQFGNPLVKALPRARLPAMLRRHKGVLQTAGLICAPEEREELAMVLLRAGVVRVTGPGDMSRTTCGDAHDGDYPLRRYTRVTER
ncbi:acyl-CoA reductase [Intestinimonas timonensis]|uniref:acyl-CoA reductase n=1 Tax=Intestinimonas timonensis TaxID=1689270 RepID=UPI001031B9E8|nr:acyl-CoA reductase [Intestinimonas timonensis]